jgi:hypothetical protein
MMRRSRASVAFGIAAGVLAAMPATAAAAQVDQRSDRAALTSYHSYLQGVSSRIPAVRKAESAFVSSISQRCAGALIPLKNVSTASANQAALFDFGEELGGSAFVVAYGTPSGEFAKMAVRLEKLHWSSPRTAKTVKRYVTAQEMLFAVAPGDVCTDAQALVASRAQTVPPGAAQWFAQFRGAAVAQQSAAAAFGKVLDEFQTPVDRSLVASDSALLRSLNGKLKGVADSGATHIVHALGL